MFLNKKLIGVIIGLIVLLLIIIFLVPNEKCGSTTTAIPKMDVDCTCIGIKHAPMTFGGGPIYCKGVCLKDTCETPREEMVKFYNINIPEDMKFRGKKSFLESQEIFISYDKEKEVFYGLYNSYPEQVEFTVNYYCVKRTL